VEVEKRTDSELVAAARAGDRQAFDRLVERYQSLALRVARGMVADEELARDLAQEAMLQAYLSLEHVREGSRFKSWLRGIVRNVCRSHLRAQRTDWLSLEALTGGMVLDADSLSGSGPDPQSAAVQREQRRMVSAAVDALAPLDRAVAMRFYSEQLSLKEIGEAEGLSVSAVKNRLYRARKQLREQLLRVDPDLDGSAGTRTGRNAMARVIIDRVVTEPPAGGSATVVLRDETGQRTLRVAMGTAEASAIDAGVRKLTLLRPMTFRLMAGLLEATGARLEEVRIEALKHGILYAVAKLRRGKSVRELDARPSDALALAAHTGSPIYVADEIMGQSGRDLPDATDSAQRFDAGNAPIPELLPVLPIRDAVFFPRMLFPLFVGREMSIRALDEAQAKDRCVLLLAQKDASVDNPRPEDVYATGTVVRLIQLLQLPDQTVRVMAEGIARARVLEYLQTEPFHLARVQVLADEEDTSAEAAALAAGFLERYEDLRQGKSIRLAPAPSGMRELGPGEIADMIASWMSLPVVARQELLEATDPRERLGKLGSYLSSPAETERRSGQGTMLEPGSIWHKHTERARQVIFLAQEEAAQRGESFIYTEHLLLGLIRIPEGVAAQILVGLGISLESIREQILQRGVDVKAAPGRQTLLSPGAQRTIDFAHEEAKLLENDYIGTEHILIGLIREGEGLAARTLVKLGADLERARQELNAMQSG
jgi:RNA polymerase sigma factor (sigma-70 family)